MPLLCLCIFQWSNNNNKKRRRRAKWQKWRTEGTLLHLQANFFRFSFSSHSLSKPTTNECCLISWLHCTAFASQVSNKTAVEVVVVVPRQIHLISRTANRTHCHIHSPFSTLLLLYSTTTPVITACSCHYFRVSTRRAMHGNEQREHTAFFLMGLTKERASSFFLFSCSLLFVAASWLFLHLTRFD